MRNICDALQEKAEAVINVTRQQKLKEKEEY